jgi:hypothetical protein
MVQVVEMAARAMDKIREEVDSSVDFEVVYEGDNRLSSKEKKAAAAEDRAECLELSENAHLAYRATAAYFAEMANDAKRIVEAAAVMQVEKKYDGTAIISSQISFGPWFAYGPDRAEVSREGKMPIITIGNYVTPTPVPSDGGRTRPPRFVPLAKYRYNPTSDKLQRIG